MDPNQPQPTPPPIAPQPQPTPMLAPTPTPAPVSPPAMAQNPGHGLGIASLISSFFIGLLGLILGIVALKKSKRAGMSNGLAVAGIIIGALSTIGVLLLILGAIVGFMTVNQKCTELGSGTHVVGSSTFTCGDSYGTGTGSTSDVIEEPF